MTPYIPTVKMESNDGVIFYGNPSPADRFLITGIAASGTTGLAELFSSITPFSFNHWPNMEVDRDQVGAAFRWGAMAVKMPDAWNEDVLSQLEGIPLTWIVSVREVVSVAVRQFIRHRSDDHPELDINHFLTDVRRRESAMWEWFLGLKSPKALISYERLIVNRQRIRFLLREWVNERRTAGSSERGSPVRDECCDDSGRELVSVFSHAAGEEAG